MLAQITKGPNIFYIVITVLQCIGPISDSNGVPTVLPALLFLIAISMVKDFFEVRKAWAADKEENDRQVEVFETKAADDEKERLTEQLIEKPDLNTVQWRDLKVG